MKEITRSGNERFPRRWMMDDNLAMTAESSLRLTAETFRARAKIGNLRFVEEGEGNLVSSMVELGQHRPILDLDFAHQYVPSSTEGHGHLYIDHLLMDDTEYFGLLSSLHHFGILGRGSVEQFKAHAMSLVRAPGVTKP